MRHVLLTCTLLLMALSPACINHNTVSDDTQVTKRELAKAYFLLGEWQNTTPEGILTESWKQLNDSVFLGQSYFMSGKDTSFSENIRLEQRSSGLYYIPVVSDQNAGKPVEFKLTTVSAVKLSFENPQHDFPSRITYTLITKDSIQAGISGVLNGKKNTQLFPFTRIKL